MFQKKKVRKSWENKKSKKSLKGFFFKKLTSFKVEKIKLEKFKSSKV